MKNTGKATRIFISIITLLFTFALFLVPTWSLWWRSCYEDVHIDPIAIVFVYLLTCLVTLIISTAFRKRKSGEPSPLPRKIFHIVVIYNIIALVYSLVVYPYLLRNDLFWSAFGSYSGVMCHLGGGEVPRTVFVVEDFWIIYTTTILPLSAILIALGIVLLKLQKSIDLKKYMFSLKPALSFLLKLILSSLVIAGGVIFLVIQKQVWDKYEVISVNGNKSEAEGCLLYYFENYKKEKFYFDGTLYDNDLEFDTLGTFWFPNDIIQEYLEDGDMKKLEDANKETFEVVRFDEESDSEGYDSYAKDKNSFYCHGETVANINAQKVKSYGGPYWGDEDSIYFGCTEVEDIDASTARHLSDYWIRDDDSLYYQTVKLDYAADSVEILGMFKIRVFNKWVYDISLDEEDGRVKYRYLKDESVLE